MQIISKGYFLFSSFLVIAGLVLARLLWPLMGSVIYMVTSYQYGKYVLIFGVGIPLAIANIFECKYVWGRILRNTKIDLFGISVGFMAGLIVGSNFW